MKMIAKEFSSQFNKSVTQPIKMSDKEEIQTTNEISDYQREEDKMTQAMTSLEGYSQAYLSYQLYIKKRKVAKRSKRRRTSL